MRWQRKPYSHGEIRIVRRFLILPFWVDDEWRWLETSYIKQRYENGYMDAYWADIEWSTKEAYDTKKRTG